MINYLKTAAVAGLVLAALCNNTTLAEAVVVACTTPSASIQIAVDKADGPATIFVKGTYVGDVTNTTDNNTLSGN